MSEVADPGSPGETVQLDPFGYFPNMASRIAGLPGELPSHEPAYVFHTCYVPVAAGRRRFAVRFVGLAAQTGTLTLRVHMLSAASGGHAKLVDSERFRLADLAADGGEAAISFFGYEGMTFALYGMIPDFTDATAEGLAVTVDLSGDQGSAAAPEEMADLSPSPDISQGTAAIVAVEPPTLSAPVSQYYTLAQLDEEPARRWQGAEDFGDLDASGRWQTIFLLEALQRFGFLQPGLKAAMVGDFPAPLSNALDRNAIPLHAFAGRGERAGNELPAGSRFDMLISNGIVDGCGSAAAAVDAVLKPMKHVRGGGFVAHAFSVTPIDATDRPSARPAADVERLAISLIAHGHAVAQVKLPRAPRSRLGMGRKIGVGLDIVPFVLIARCRASGS